MVILTPIPFNIANRIIQTKQGFNLPLDSFIYIYKVDYSTKIVCFIENRHITGLAILVWKHDRDPNPWEQLVTLNLINNTGTKITSNDLAKCIYIQQIDNYNFEIKGIISKNCYIYNLNVFTINEYKVIIAREYCIKQNKITTEIGYYEYEYTITQL
jgi:hypothetical protein